MNDTEKYNDIINLPHHQSKTRPHMPNSERAAQFSPFAALKGYEEEIEETARYTEEKPEFDEAAVSALNEKLVQLKERMREGVLVSVTYFQADERKAGGAVRSLTGNVKKIDEYARRLIMRDETVIAFENLIEIEFLS